MNQPSRRGGGRGRARAVGCPRRRAAAAPGAPEFAARLERRRGGAPPGRAALRWQLGTLRQYGGTFFFFRSEMDPLNTLWLAPVGSAMVARRCSGHTQGRGDVMEMASRWLPSCEASVRRGDGWYLSPGGCTSCYVDFYIASVLRPLAS